MKKLTTLTIILALFLWRTSFATVLIVDNNSYAPANPVVGHFTTIQAAVSAANNGDTIYVVGSPTSYGTITIWTTNKFFVFIGAGYRPQKDFYYSSKIDDINAGNINPANGNNSKIFGFEIAGHIGKDGSSCCGGNGMEIAYNKFVGGGAVVASGDNCNIHDNYFEVANNGGGYGVIQLFGDNPSLIHNNIFSRLIGTNGALIANGPPHAPSSNLIYNNLFLSASGGFVFNNIGSSTMANNIFYGYVVADTTIGHPTNCIFDNNLVFNSGNNFILFDNNTTSTGINYVDTMPVFVNPTANYAFDFPPYDFSLDTSSIGHNGGTDTTDLGAFGGTNPFHNFTGTQDIPQVVKLDLNDSIIWSGDSLTFHVTGYANAGDSIVAAEYFVGVDTNGTSKSIPITIGSTFDFYYSINRDSLPIGEYVFGFRVKNSQGIWSFPEMRKLFIEDIYMRVENRPFTRPGAKEKYTVTLVNNSAKNIYDLFLISFFNKATNFQLAGEPDSIAGVAVKNIPLEFDTVNTKIVPIWIYSVPSYTTKTIDIYITSGSAGSHELVNNSFELWYNKAGESDNTFNATGIQANLNSSSLFNASYELPYVLDSALLLNYLDSSFYNSQFLWYQNNILPDMILPLSHIIKASFSNYGNFSDSTIEDFSHSTFNIILSKYFAGEGDTSNLRLASNTVCPPPCPILPNCQSPVSPLPEVGKLEVNAQYCAIRCRSWGDDFHKGWDIKPKRVNGGKFNSPTDTCEIYPFVWVNCRDYWDGCAYPVKAIYDGEVIETSFNSGEGLHVKIKSCVGTNDEFVTEYNHLCKFFGPPSGTISAGTTIGFVGETGKGVTGIHLDIKFERTNGGYQDPECYLSSLTMNKNTSNQNIPCKPCTSAECMGFAFARNSFSTSTISNTNAPVNCQSLIGKKCTACENFNSGDPNDKIGNEGSGNPRYILYNDELHYGVFFQNADTVQLPAKVVSITDTLDVSKMDVTSLHIESISAGEMIFVLPDSVHIQNLDTIYNKRSINGEYVHLQTSFDTITGVLQFLLTSLDTVFLQPDTAFNTGFLPPDTSHFDGNGLVSFKVFPKSAIPDGTVIYNTAHIIFDGNPDIATGTWFNTIDRAEPSSHVNPLPPITNDTAIVVSWTGIDLGSGAAHYDIYSKTSGDTSFTQWLSYTTLTTDTFYGICDSTYQFYSVVYDSVGNVESKSDTIEAFTLLNCTVGIQYIFNSSDLKVYPNPSNGKLTIEATLPKDGKLNIEVFDLLSQRVFSFDDNGTNKKYLKKEIDLSSQTDGVYLIRLNNSGHTEIRKFILRKN